jgi:hypothetical protein
MSTKEMKGLELRPKLGRRKGLFVKFCKRAATALKKAPAPRAEVLDTLRKEAKPSSRLISTGQLDLLFVKNVVLDLVSQGWELSVRGPKVKFHPPRLSENSHSSKDFVRSRHLLGRNAQLSEQPVTDFLKRMERRHLHGKEWHSIFSVMRDGRDLAERLWNVDSLQDSEQRATALSEVVSPYIQFADPDTTCQYTGLRLGDIWRYFRYTWVNEYKSVPGRSMMILIRDAAAPNHPVIGIAALSSSVVQHRRRDEWIGWQPQTFVDYVTKKPSKRVAVWLLDSVDRLIQGLYLADLVSDGVCSRSQIASPNQAVIDRLVDESKRAMTRHRRNPQKSLHKGRKADFTSSKYWKAEARTHLYRSKRCRKLADLLTIRKSFHQHSLREASQQSFRKATESAAMRASIAQLTRMVKAEHVGIDMLDITVCGALAPYNLLLGGKLVCMLLCSPEVTQYYSKRYARQVSIIASACKGKPVIRKPNLVLICTTSLYGVGSSQYNRVKIPLEKLGGRQGEEILFENLGHSYGFGTYHFSKETIKIGSVIISRRTNSRRVNSIFGEGVNPLMRKIREALDVVGLQSDELLQHGNRRVTYGVRLARNYRAVLTGFDKRPSYLIPQSNARHHSAEIADHWRRRWLSPRTGRAGILDAVAQHNLAYPIRHGAAVPLPSNGNEPDLTGANGLYD